MLVWLKFLASFFHPPGLNCLLLLVGIYYWMKSNKLLSVVFLFGGTVFLYLISTPVVSQKLLEYSEGEYKSYKFYELVNNKDPKAIVALAAIDPADSWLINKNVAWLAKATRIPVVVSGNSYILEDNNPNNIVENMAKSLANDFGVTGAVWVEGKGYYLKENAKLVKQILDKNGIKKVFLVANAWRINRAEKEFKAVGLEVVLAPVVKNLSLSSSQVQKFTPRLDCLANSSYFFFGLFQGVWSQVFEMMDHK